MVIIVALLTVPAALWVLLLLRLSALRKDRVGPRRYFGSPLDGTLLLHEVLSEDLYTDEGRRLLPWVRGSLVLLIAGFLAGLILIARRM
jgi:hypothetical protein